MKKRSTRKILALALTAALILGLSACSFDGAMAKAVTKLARADSLHGDMTVDIVFSVAGIKTSSYTQMSADCLTEPFLMSGEMTTDTIGVDVQTQYYADKEGESYNIYTSTNGHDWEVETTSDREDTGSIDIGAALSFYLSVAASFEKIGVETVNGTSAVRYDGYIPESSIIEVLETSGISKTLSIDTSDADIADVVRGIGDIPVSVWLEKGTGLPVKYTMDMSTAIEVILENVTGTFVSSILSVEVSRALVTIEASDYNAVESFEIPAEIIATAEED